MLIYVDILAGQWILYWSVHSYADEWRLLSMDGMDDYELISSAVIKLVLENESRRMKAFLYPAVLSSAVAKALQRPSYCLAAVLIPT
jgi:hypothetical protein